ncbi:phosphate ABC transporter permease subunit PstC [Haploplasma axanthum]|uniref:Phosphate transport system permease protein n=1 Tax=Haploplasma axanthum TaxID=29552 RepID=A0A449BFU9_HAPAX|nr:phosphate ABC transporter permease subunit PstC [Haploplasma axanthum]VEU81308.1 Phosphate transport system permease protein pstC [Haploplasma axanthum]
MNVESKNVKINKIMNITVKSILLLATVLSASIIILIIWQIASHGIRPFTNVYGDNRVDFLKFIRGTSYSQTNYQIGFIIINTLYVVFLSVLISVPISVLTALFIAKIAPKVIGKTLTTVVEVLAAIPSIIFGVFGSGYITVLVKNIADKFGISTAGGLSVLSSVIVLTMMILPTITMLSITAIKSVPSNIEEGSLALGTSKTQTMFNITLKAAVPGIFAGIILGVGRALGEATAISLVAGNIPSGPSFSLFDPTRTLTSTILMGFKETEGLDYDIRFSIGLVLITIILLVNFILNYVRKRISSKYEN